jgi:hypothetical protein
MRRSALLFLLAFTGFSNAEPVTYTKHIAPILFKQCVSCHREGEIAPFSLMTYAEAKKKAALIANVTSNKRMPVWKPEAGHGEFEGERRLTDREIAMLYQWAEDGAPEGNPKDLPVAPKFKTGWQLGKPDIVLKMPEKFKVPAEGRDIYVHFVFPLPIDKEIYVRGVECRPGL